MRPKVFYFTKTNYPDHFLCYIEDISLSQFLRGHVGTSSELASDAECLVDLGKGFRPFRRPAVHSKRGEEGALSGRRRRCSSPSQLLIQGPHFDVTYGTFSTIRHFNFHNKIPLKQFRFVRNFVSD